MNCTWSQSSDTLTRLRWDRSSPEAFVALGCYWRSNRFDDFSCEPHGSFALFWAHTRLSDHRTADTPNLARISGGEPYC